MNKVLQAKLERLKEEALYLRSNQTRILKELQSSPDIKRIAERSVYLCAEIVLDIADMVIVMKGLPKPSTYSDSIRKLGEYGIVPKAFARKFLYIAGLRNFLAHDYQVDTRADLERFMKSGLKDIGVFIAHIEKT